MRCTWKNGRFIVVFVVTISCWLLHEVTVYAAEDENSWWYSFIDGAEDAAEWAKDRAPTVKEKASEVIDNAKEKVPEVKDQAGEIVDKVKEKVPEAKEKLDEAGEQFKEWNQQQQDEFWGRTNEQLQSAGDTEDGAEGDTESSTLETKEAEEPTGLGSSERLIEPEAVTEPVEPDSSVELPSETEPAETEAAELSDTESSDSIPLDKILSIATMVLPVVLLVIVCVYRLIVSLRKSRD